MADKITIRQPLDAEREQLALLSANTFRNDLAGARRWYEKINLDEVLCLAENGRIVSSIIINPYTAFVGGGRVGLAGIGGVMTAVDRQGRGYAMRLMTAGLAVMRRRGQALSTLYPFSHVYYGRLGYALAADHLVYPELTQRDLPRYDEFRMVDRWLPGDSLRPLIAPHNRIMQRYNLCCERPIERWEKIVARLEERKSFLYVIRDRGKVIGWFAADNQRRDAGHESMTMSMALGGRVAFRAMIGLLARLPTNVKKIILHLPPDFELWDIQGEPAKTTRQPDMQARVVDLADALRYRGYSRGVAGRLTFRIADRQARWNHGTWQARWSGGELVSLTPSPAGGGAAPGREDIRTSPSHAGGGAAPGRGDRRSVNLSADIASFTQIYCGYRSARTLAELGKITVSSPAVLDLLDALFHDRPTHTQDWF